MLFCELARIGPDALDDLGTLVTQLRAAGIEACVGAGSVPVEITRSAMFELAAHVRKDPPGAGDALLLLRGHEIDDAGLARLRRLGAPEGLRTLVMGRFPTFQSEIGIRVKLSYVLGESPEVLDVAPGLGGGQHYLPVFGVRGARAPRRDGRPALLLVSPNLEEEPQVQALIALAASPSWRTIVLTDGRAKQAWSKRFGRDVTIFHYGEAEPAALASLTDIAMLFKPPSSSYRGQSLVADLLVGGVAVVDCSPGWAHARYAAPMLQGPSDLQAAGAFLGNGVLSSLGVIGREVTRSKFAALLEGGEALAAIRRLEQDRHPPRPAVVSDAGRSAEGSSSSGHIVLVPTNGVGLGHAQRCSLVAAEIAEQGSKPTFAAFPSCMKMLKSYGFDVMPLVSRSTFHRQEHDNDLLNYLRLRQLTAGGGVLVFDGGYVFDSIYRSVLENRLSGVWIRRGLWQEGQSNGVALDREKVFRRVIVPNEAFEELNSPYSWGSHVHAVGPIVQTVSMSAERREALRSSLRVRFGRDFCRLAVTMLGGGVAADRSAQVAAICAMMAGRPDTLHLVVVWPTATVEAGAFTWPNSRIVKTHHASALVAASDLFISAVGYNSFHEVIYNGVPTIFMAQMSAYMDDQRRRAVAAVNRRLSDIVEPNEMHSLRSKVIDILDGSRGQEMRERLAAIDLPEPGTAEAARLIMETAECPRAAGRPSLPALPAVTPRISTTSFAPMMTGPTTPELTSSLKASA